MLKKYTCNICGIVTRVTGNEVYKACACLEDYTVEYESVPGSLEEDQESAKLQDEESQ